MAINGTNDRDVFEGTRFDDEINGFGGNDLFRGSRGGDRLDGGSGIDAVDYSISVTHFPFGIPHPHDGEAVDVDLQRATQLGGFAEGDTLISVENVGGSTANDVLRGNSGANVLAGSGGDDIIEGRGGDDTLLGDAGIDFDLGVAGNDILDGGAGNDELIAGGGNDTLIGSAGTNTLDGGAGTDTSSYAGSAFGMLVSLVGSNSNGIAFAQGSTDGDSMFSIENIIGSNFADIISGSSVANVLNGGGGNDLISGGGGADTLIGGAGIDTASYTGSSAGVSVNLGVLNAVNTPFGTIFVQTVAGRGTGGDAQGDTLAGFENLTGSNFNDTLTGDLAANRINEGAGDDNIVGGAGNDVLISGSQVDIDRITGGAGLDTFLYQSREDSRAIGSSAGDFIQDFRIGEDRLDFHALNLNVNQLVIANRSDALGNASTVFEDLDANGVVDTGEFAVEVRIDGAGFVTLQDMLL